MAEKNILCRAIIDIVGKPKEHVEKAIKLVIEKIKEMDGVNVEKTDIAKTKSLKNEKLGKTEEKIQKEAGELFSTFAEIDLYVNNIDTLSLFTFQFMPSSIEIIEPEFLKIRAVDISKAFNDAIAKVHSADLIVKKMSFENAALRKNSGLLLRNMIMVSLSKKEKNIDELSNSVGIPAEQLKPFLENLVKQEFIKEEKGIYKSK